MIQARIAKHLPAGPDSAAFTLDAGFEAGAGVTVLFGPSGSGKTLTLDALAGFVRPDAGRILLDGRILFDAESGVHLPARSRCCGYVFQSHALFPHMTLRENLAFGADALPRLERHRRIAEQLERFGLASMAGRRPHELSGGQRQRGAIARALIAEPRMVLLDEPAGGLDAVLRDDLRTLILEMRASLKIPVLLVTHDEEDCFALADRILVYDAGRIVQQSAPLDLLRNPASVAVARLIGGFNIFEAEVLALDPAKQTSRLRVLDQEIGGPNLRGCFRGDRISVCARPEELTVWARPGENRLRAELIGTVERPQSIRADFGSGLLVDVPRLAWSEVHEAARGSGWWIEIPAAALRQISGR